MLDYRVVKRDDINEITIDNGIIKHHWIYI